MKRIFMLLLACLALGWQAQAQSSWTIGVANNGTMGGYFETADGASQHAVAYSTTWPSNNLVPTLYIHFPQGSFTVTSSNAAAVRATVVRVATETTIVSSQSARNFSLTIPAEGWYRMKLTGGTAGSTTLSDFTVTGTASGTNTSSNVFLADWRSVASLHLNGFSSTDTSLPSGNAFDWAYTEVQIPTDADFYGTYVESFGFSGGYMGIQNNGGNNASGGRTVIFSLWDSGDTDTDPTLVDYKRSGVLATGTAESVVSTRFGGEGTGASVRLTGELWKAGQWVKFLVNSRPEEIPLEDGTLWQNTLVSAWYWAEGVDTEWHYIGTMRQAGVNTYINPYNAFLEEYTRTSTSQGNKAHKAYYRRMFTRAMQSGQWYNRNSFWFGNTDNSDGHRGDFYQTGVDDYQGEPAMYMESGGYTRYGGEQGTTSIPLKSPTGIVPTQAELDALVQRDVLPAIQQQDEDRMASAIGGKTMDETTGWTVTGYSDEETVGESSGSQGLASLLTDGDETTYWHSKWYGSSKAYPHYFELTHADGLVNVDDIVIVGESGHTATNYQAKTVDVYTSTNGTRWTFVESCTLSAGFPQTITLSSTLNTKYLKLNFTESMNGTSNNMCIAELTFKYNSVDKIRALAETYLNNADQFNGYSTADLAALQAVYDNASSTYADYETALTNLAANGTVLKYGKLTSVASLSAEKAYVLRNIGGYGDLVYDTTNNRATLRNADGDALTTAGRTQYKDIITQHADVTADASNWMFIAGTGDDDGYYYLYNIGAAQYFDPSTSSFSATPTPVDVAYTSGYFYIYKKGTSAYYNNCICAAPQLPEGQNVTKYQYSDTGCQWYIYDNYSNTPSAELIEQLRVDAGLCDPYLVDNVDVTWRVVDADNDVLYTVTKTYNSAITAYPEELTAYEDVYVSYPNKVSFEGFTPTADMIYDVLAEPAADAPFAWAKTYETARPYIWNMNNHVSGLSPRYITSAEVRSTPLASNTASYYKGTETYENTPAYRWRFTGNPFTGFSIYNDAYGENYKLQDSGGTTNPSDNTTYPILSTTGTQTWEVLHNSTGTDGFTIKLRGSENVYMNNNRGIDYLGYWISASGLNDAGGYMQLTPADEVTLTFALEGTSQTFTTQAVVGTPLTAYPTSLTDFATEHYLALNPATPALTPTQDATINVAWSFNGPFTLAASSTDTEADLYTLKLRASYVFAGAPGDASATSLSTVPSPVAQSRWIFTGSPLTGVQVWSAANPTLGLTAGQTTVGLSSSPTTWDLVRVDDTNFSLRNPATQTFASDWGTYIGFWSDNSNMGMYFQTEVADVSDDFEGGYFRIRNVGKPAMYLTTANGQLAVTDQTTDLAETTMRLTPRGDGFFTLGRLGEYTKEVATADYGTPAQTTTEASEAYPVYVGRNSSGEYVFTIYTNALYGYAHIDAASNVVRWETTNDASRWEFLPIDAESDVKIVLTASPQPIGGASDMAIATAYMPYAYALPAGVEALVIRPNEARTRAEYFVLASGYVPEATPVVLLGDAGSDAVLSPCIVSDADVSADASLLALNELKGTFVSLPSQTGILVLNVVDGTPGFYQLMNGVNLLPYKAYLDFTSSAGVRGLNLAAGDATGISAAEDQLATEAASLYDLTGRRVTTMQRGGIYIQNGRKVLR
ncbi:MAG: DUF3472 domain-containing protein [Alloprevotella sp.]|nr:DUF3472 domain-containing protein [Alloprevotella sp.]